MTFQACAAHPEGEGAIARAAARCGCGFVVPHFGGTPLEEVAAASIGATAAAADDADAATATAAAAAGGTVPTGGEEAAGAAAEARGGVGAAAGEVLCGRAHAEACAQISSGHFRWLAQPKSMVWIACVYGKQRRMA